MQCPHCSTTFKIPEEFVARKARCKRCGRPFVVALLAPRPARPDTLSPKPVVGGFGARESHEDHASEPGFFGDFDKIAEVERAEYASAPLRECPFCAEEISAKAKKCRFCGEVIEDSMVVAPSVSGPRRSSSARERTQGHSPEELDELAGAEFPWVDWVITFVVWGLIAYKVYEYGSRALSSWQGLFWVGVGAVTAADAIRRTAKHLNEQ
jgi:hypothetical protein